MDENTPVERRPSVLRRIRDEARRLQHLPGAGRFDWEDEPGPTERRTGITLLVLAAVFCAFGAAVLASQAIKAVQVEREDRKPISIEQWEG